MTEEIHLDPAARGRPRSFDEDEVLDQVMRVFWRHGFEGTTYEALEEATSLRRQSLRYAYGSKREMFRRALDHYIAGRIAQVEDILTASGPIHERLSEALQLWRNDAAGPLAPGCLMVNTAGELGSRDPELAKRITRATDKLITLFARALGSAIDDGKLAVEIDPRALAVLLVTAGDGSLVHSRLAGDSTPTDVTTETLLTLLR